LCPAVGEKEKKVFKRRRQVYLRRFPVWLINMIVSLFTATITEVVSNTAAANILLPILKEMSITLCANPTYLGNLS
jgi:di/tricarboxylate transporter